MLQSDSAQRAFPLREIGATLPRRLPAPVNDAPPEDSLRAFLQREEFGFEGRNSVTPENFTNLRAEFLNSKMLTWIEKPPAPGNRGRRRRGGTVAVSESRLTLQRPPRVFLSKYRFRTAAVRWPFIRPLAAAEGKKQTTLKSLRLQKIDVFKTAPMARLVAMLLGMSVRPQREGDARRARLKSSGWLRDKRVFVLETTNSLLLQSAVEDVEQQRSRRAAKTAVIHKADVLHRWRCADDKDDRPAIALIEEIGRLKAACRPTEGKTPLPRVKALAHRQRFQDVSPANGEARRPRIPELLIPGSRVPGSRLPADRVRNLREQQRRLELHFHEQKIRQSQSELETDGRVWERPIQQPVPAFIPRTGRRATIIAVSDLGGGERKATMVAELGANLAEQGDRVLVVDLDYRGTLSEICLPADVRSRLRSDGNTVLRWLQPYPARHGGIPTNCIVPVKNGFYAVTADQSLGVWEARERAAWLVRPDGGDVRFRLRGMLHSPEISRRFDWILVNCPSRLSTAAINAFTSSDYLMFSPAPKHVSQPLIGRLLAWLARLNVSTGICRGLSLLGAVDLQDERAAGSPDPIKARPQLGGTRSNTIHSRNVRSGSRWNDGVYYFANTIPTTASVATAARLGSRGEPIARACKQGGFANLAREMKARADRGRRN